MSFTDELFKRRILQILAIYLGFTFAAFEFTDIIVERYGLSDGLVDAVLVGLIALLPSVVMLAWNHGAPGKDRWRKRELVGIPLNVLVAGALLMKLTATTAPEAASELRTATDENGQAVTMEVPRQDLVDRVTVFFFDPESFTDVAPWEAYALSQLIGSGLNRDLFVETYSVYQQYSQGHIWKIKRAGHENGLGAPVTLLADIANGYHQDFFTTGTLQATQEGYRATVRLFRARPLEEVASIEVAGANLFELADASIDGLIPHLSAPSDDTVLRPRLPAEEVLTDNVDALRLYIEGLNAITMRNDFGAAIASWGEAVALDPSFAAAFEELVNSHSNQGEYDQALGYVKQLNRLTHKLTERKQILLKARGYQLRNEMEKATQVFEMWTELHAEDHNSWTSLGYNYLWNGNRTDDALQAFQKSLEIMPNQHWLIWQIARLHQVRGEEDLAIEAYERYHKILPENYLPLIALGDIYTHRGDLTKAENYFNQGKLAQTEMVTPVLRLAMNQARQGNVNEAFVLFDEAEFIAEAPRQHAAVLGARARVRALLGQPKAALKLLKKQLEIGSQTQSRLDANINHMRAMLVYVQAGANDEAEAYLASMDDLFAPPFDFIPSIGYMILRMAEGNAEDARLHNRKVDQAIEESNRTDLKYLTEYTLGIIQRSEGEVEEGLSRLENALALAKKSIQQVNDDGETDIEDVRLELANTALAADRPDRALAVLNPILTSWPMHPEANWLAAQAHHKLGDGEAAAAAQANAQRLWTDAEPEFEMAQAAQEPLGS
ncbi:MAG: tetratricopeptide repeat protein [Pseudomonadota bacterium]